MRFIAAFAELPLGVRYSAAAVIGVAIGAAVNWAVSALAYEPRQFSPWAKRRPRDARSGPLDRVPLVGWLRLRRLERQLGPGFWIRPLIVEIACGLAAALWYWWEAVVGGLLPARVAGPNIAQLLDLRVWLHLQFAIHIALAAFMLAASLIDADEKNIPDGVTVPGALTGLTLVTLFPNMLLPDGNQPLGNFVWFLTASAPNAWPTMLRAGPFVPSLLIGLACFWFWCGGLLIGGRFPLFRWNRRRLRRVFQTASMRIRLDRATPRVLGIGVVGSLLIALVWHFDPLRWQSCVSSLIGLAVGAAIVWTVRIFGGWAFQKEAMGFGDVTLMAMIGAFLGWQPTLMVFFLAPIAALLVTLPSFLLGKREMLPYGPYLCAAAVGILAAWAGIWPEARLRFSIPWLIPGVVLSGFVILGVVLALLRGVRSLTAGDESR